VRAFKNKVAVVTGAASGIGRALADRCGREGMKVVLADVEKPLLAKAEAEMKAAGIDVVAVPTDVTSAAAVEALAQRALSAFGAVHLLCNNAGVAAGSTAWGTTIHDWEWVLSVNLWGVIHGIRVFVPIMLKQDAESHVVNTASAAGLMSFHEMAPYLVTKHAVVALSEKLHYDLEALGGKVKVSALCPGWVRTKIMDSQRNRPNELANDPASEMTTPGFEKAMVAYRQAAEEGMPPETIADAVLQAIREDRFYILTHPELTSYLSARMEAIVAGTNPLPRERVDRVVEK
jgi:NAD(P)-dependent dehydrogenase (short-subunit alcohol dehydrogenase family)